MSENNNSKHAKVKKILKIAGLCSLIVGLVCAIISLVSFFVAMNNGEIPKLFWLSFVGFPLIAAGAAMLMLGFQKEISSYTANEAAPVINQMSEQISPAVKAVAQAVNSVSCPSCGAANDVDSEFCKKCGAKLSKTCPHCGKSVDADSAFCDGCGKPLE